MKTSLTLLALVVIASYVPIAHGGPVPIYAAPLVAVAPAVVAAPSAVSYAYTHRVHAPLAAAYPVQYVIG